MRHHRRRHRNPISLGGLKSSIVPAAIGAAGAVAADYAYTYLSPYLPSALTSIPYSKQIVQLAIALGLGMGAKKVLGPGKGEAVMMGALTVAVYNLLATTLGGTSGMAGLGAYMNRGMSGLGVYSPNPAPYLSRPKMAGMGRVGRMGAYMRPSQSGVMSGFGAYITPTPAMGADEMFD